MSINNIRFFVSFYATVSACQRQLDLFYARLQRLQGGRISLSLSLVCQFITQPTHLGFFISLLIFDTLVF